mmetsp:Transcript_13875/g.45265  ORF Transcript_13875/g.45265 Transcript_13875/m.45265 type:complete len:146 (-) Transcript_13875:184-621(-)|eukprot:CAMPEP_0118902574 /NCGR_PEP_ID=MMETSP1166-20130328/7799_1 /TAXON_ID=1104430 /ORGANISM="Chrysoreinhardia sp, Strain CCMP3193" /LENGTH=145 /DNA_ID=CAMNT_0006841783 /DNA_START=27 /DNA_END=467 /DNA_ORIENTATION=+
MNASPEVLWKCVRKNTSFMVKRNGIQLTSEPGNVMNKNSFKYSGLANAKTVDIAVDGEDAVTMGLKAPKRIQHPKEAIRVTPLKKDFRRVARSIKTQVGGQWYRADLADMALARYSAIYNASMIKKGLKKAAKKKAGRRAAAGAA